MNTQIPATLDILKALASVLVALAAVTGSVVAVMGLKTWQRELRGRTEYDLARRILGCVYGVREAVRNFRNPFMFSAEYRTTDTPSGEAPTDTDNLAVAYANRWNLVREAQSRLDVDLLEAEAIWGDDLKHAQQALRVCVARLFSNTLMYLSHKRKPKQLGPPSPDYEQTVFWQGDGDPFDKNVGEAVSAYEAVLKPYLKR